MTKQEKIMEGIQRIVVDRGVALAIIEYLNDNDVVIKVDDYIPITITGLENGQIIQTKLPPNVTVVEPLIEK